MMITPEGGCRTKSEEMEECSFFDCTYEGDRPAEETDEFVAIKLRELEREIDKLPDNIKDAYYVALAQEIKQKTHYVRSKEFLLGFLRADSFDAPKAAMRVARFFEFKLDLFGPEKLPRRIRQADLNEDDKKVLASGYLHLGGLDCGQRLVLLFQRNRLLVHGLLNEHYAKSICRVTFYQLLFASEDKNQCHRNVVVAIRWSLNSSLSLKDYRLLFRMSVNMYAQAIPFRFDAVHSCCSNATERSCVSFAESVTTRYSQHKSGLHGPSPAACFAGLSQYGIDVGSLPFTEVGDFKHDIHQEQLEQMRQKENELSALLSEFKSLHNLDVGRKNPGSDQPKHSSQNCTDGIDQQHLLQPVEYQPANSSSGTEVEEKETDQPMLSQSFQSNNSNCDTFAEKHLPWRLMDILVHKTAQDSIWWTRGGTAFAMDKRKLVETVLHNEFNGIKFDSFHRRLKRWGFKRLPSKGILPRNCVEYQHSLFKKDSPELLKGWNSINVKDKLPVRLRKVLDSNRASDAIWWVNDGTAFAIKNDEHSCSVLRDLFEGLKFNSFYRMLKKWQFKRLPYEDKSAVNVLVFCHELFQQNLQLTPEQLDQWTDELARISSARGENFPKKLYRVLDSTQNKDSIWWLEDGKAFAIQRTKFDGDVLRKEYNGIKFESFHRSLKRWGFKQLHIITPIQNVIIFCHPSFQKHCPELLSKWPKHNNQTNSDDEKIDISE